MRRSPRPTIPNGGIRMRSKHERGERRAAGRAPTPRSRPLLAREHRPADVGAAEHPDAREQDEERHERRPEGRSEAEQDQRRAQMATASTPSSASVPRGAAPAQRGTPRPAATIGRTTQPNDCGTTARSRPPSARRRSSRPSRAGARARGRGCRSAPRRSGTAARSRRASRSASWPRTTCGAGMRSPMRATSGTQPHDAHERDHRGRDQPAGDAPAEPRDERERRRRACPRARGC